MKTIIPAEPGHVALFEDDEKNLCKDEPIIAWLVEVPDWESGHDPHGYVWPITVTQCCRLEADAWILPDGRVAVPGGGVPWDSFDEAAKAWKLIP